MPPAADADASFDLSLAGVLLTLTSFITIAHSQELDVLQGCYAPFFQLCYVNHMISIFLKYGLYSIILSTIVSTILDVTAGRPINRLSTLMGFSCLGVLMVLVFIGSIITTPIQYISYDINGGPANNFYDYWPTFANVMLGYRIVIFIFYMTGIVATRLFCNSRKLQTVTIRTGIRMGRILRPHSATLQGHRNVSDMWALATTPSRP